MKRTMLFILPYLALCMSCRTSKQTDLTDMHDGYAHDHFYMEAVKMNNDGRYDSAMDLMSFSLDLDTASAASCYTLAQYYMTLAGREAQSEYAAKAEKLLLRAVRLEPDNYWYSRLLAMNYLRQKKNPEALALYEDMISRFPGRTDILMTLAGLYDDAGEYEKELRALERFGKIEDVADELKFQRFACYLQMGELDSAYYESDNPADVIELLMNTTREMIEHAESNLDKMKCRSMLDLVFSFCDVVIRHEPQLAKAYSQKSIAYFWMGENDKALDVLDQGIRNASAKDKPELFNLRGDFHHTLGDMEKMFADYDSTLFYEPDNIAVLNNYAYFMSLEDRELERALEMSARTISAEPYNSTFLDTYAWILFRLKRYKESLEYMEKALKYMETDNADLFEHYGDVLYKCGNVEKAVENWHRAMQLNSSSRTLDIKIREGKYVE